MTLRTLIEQFENDDFFNALSTMVNRNDFWSLPKNSINLEVARFLFESGFSWAMLNANTVGNKARFEIFGIVPVTFSPMRKLLIYIKLT